MEHLMMEEKKRQFAIELGLLTMKAIGQGLHPDAALEVLEARAREEKIIQDFRREMERTYR
jgi:hypothetical protein